jgi:hypothetical protein
MRNQISKVFFSSAALLLAFSLNAQAPTAVPITNEPHHHLVLENEYVRVFRVSVSANDATLMHQHDVPYTYVSLGPADFTNAVAGKPEAHAVLVDGQVGYSRGGFAHIARTAAVPFNNVTIELLHPQGDPHNRCAKVVAADPLGSCDKPELSRLVNNFSEPQFETGEMMVSLVHLDPGSNLATVSVPGTGHLLIALNDSEIQVEVAGKPKKTLHGGEVTWTDGGSPEVVSNPGKKKTAHLELIFRDSGKSGKP